MPVSFLFPSGSIDSLDPCRFLDQHDHPQYDRKLERKRGEEEEDQRERKTERSPSLIYIGVQMVLESARLLLSLSAPRRAKLRRIINDHLSSGLMTTGDASSLAGKLVWGSSTVFGRLGRAMVNPIFRRSTATDPHVNINSTLRDALAWWDHLLEHWDEGRCRVISTSGSSSPSARPLLLYPDASLFGVGYILIDPVQGRAWWGMAEYTGDCGDIAFIEGLALVSALENIPAGMLKDRQLIVFVDNSVLHGSVVRGSSGLDILTPLVHRTWLLCARLRIHAWFERVCSKDNPADIPSRFSDPSAVLESIGLWVLRLPLVIG